MGRNARRPADGECRSEVKKPSLCGETGPLMAECYTPQGENRGGCVEALALMVG
jgi:hypothetical protein